MAEIVNIDQLPESAAKKVRPYLESMIELLGSNLVTAAVYESKNIPIAGIAPKDVLHQA